MPPSFTSPSEAKAKRSHKAKDKKAPALPIELGLSDMAPSFGSSYLVGAMEGIVEGLNQSMATLASLEVHRREQQSAQRQREHEFHLAALKAVAEASRR